MSGELLPRGVEGDSLLKVATFAWPMPSSSRGAERRDDSAIERSRAESRHAGQLDFAVDVTGGGCGEVANPRVASMKIAALPLKVRSFVFPEAPSFAWGNKGSDGADRDASANGARRRSKLKRRTRMKPPTDVIKLQDRLYYLLQPPLESLVSAETIRFPFEPFPYQFEGIAFLYPRHAAILADEMGLGKTMQAISTMRLLLHGREARQILLICPKPLVSNWRREFAQWAPEIPIGVIEGDAAKRSWQWRQPGTPIKIANYELLMRDRDEVLAPDLHFDLVVLDEAQRIKNRSGTTNKIVTSIRRTRSWALTGTPVENSLDDLVGIFDFLSEGYLRPGMHPRTIAREVREYVLRRTKDMVLEDMPPKLYRDEEIDLSPEQAETYAQAEDSGVIRLNELGDSMTVQHVFELVLRLKQICNFDPSTGASSKLERLEADLAEVAASGQKAIVFSQWVKTIEKLRPRLEPFGPLEYHGKIASPKRDAILQRFKEDPKSHVLLMSYGAGSVGLNLQFCRYVFLFDRWWNPAIEDQAINRAHRIGAAGSVTVTRMTSANTIEQRIHDVLQQKRELFETVFSETGAPGNIGLTQDEIFGLFNLATPKGPIRRAG
ncbi:MAG TPA: DEAD/DEAH box helicase [Pirellulaceae bacterium]|nr:DEAD/DEAH box helicase [Pirellulaceae bacterium]